MFRFISIGAASAIYVTSQIKLFKSLHKGERVWILGNGPSAEQWSMDELRELGGYVFGTNRCWRKSPRTGAFFQGTDYHTFVAGHHFDDLMAGRVDTKLAFIPRRFEQFLSTRWIPRNRKFNGSMVMTPTKDTWKSSYGKPFMWEFDRGSCVVNFAGQLAIALSVFMGFAEIFLIGFDANDSEGHFFDAEPSKAGPPGFKRTNMRTWFPAIGEWFAAHPERKIFNCSTESGIVEFSKLSKEEVRERVGR